MTREGKRRWPDQLDKKTGVRNFTFLLLSIDLVTFTIPCLEMMINLIRDIGVVSES